MFGLLPKRVSRYRVGPRLARAVLGFKVWVGGEGSGGGREEGSVGAGWGGRAREVHGHLVQKAQQPHTTLLHQVANHRVTEETNLGIEQIVFLIFFNDCQLQINHLTPLHAFIEVFFLLTL